MSTPHRRHRSLHVLALLLLCTALLGFATRTVAHEHASGLPASDSLCAICVYGGTTLGGAVAGKPAPIEPQWHLAPECPAYRSITAPPLAGTRIRGPPAVS